MFVVDSLTSQGPLDGLSVLFRRVYSLTVYSLLLNPRTDGRIGRVTATIRLGQLIV